MPRARRVRGAHYKRQMFADKLKMYSARVRRPRTGEWPRGARCKGSRDIYGPAKIFRYANVRTKRKKKKEKKTRGQIANI